MIATSTGSFPIGFRRGWSPWQRDLGGVVRWAIENAFPHMDFGPLTPAEVKQVQDAGLTVGAVDLLRWTDLLSPDPAIRQQAVDANVAYVTGIAALGVKRFLAVMSPQDPAAPRKDNFALAAEAYGQLCAAVAGTEARIVLEGAPGRPPHFANLACTPADLRAMLKAVNSEVLGVNFDPSHLVRAGIDPLRFLHEFAPYVHHVHAKDTLLLDEDRYQHGTLQQATFDEPHRYGADAWRYALPGRGKLPWREMLNLLKETGYTGRVSIELEDKDLTTEDAEKAGLLEAAAFLRAC